LSILTDYLDTTKVGGRFGKRCGESDRHDCELFES